MVFQLNPCPEGGRFARSLCALGQGFDEVVGRSEVLRSLISAPLLELMIVGGEGAVDVAALRSAAQLEGWDRHAGYMDMFWRVLGNMDDEERRRFVLFCTASDREPLRGWRQLSLIIRRHGTGDDRLPTAYTCFHTLLLPKYSNEDRLAEQLRRAITQSEGFGLE